MQWYGLTIPVFELPLVCCLCMTRVAQNENSRHFMGKAYVSEAQVIPLDPLLFGALEVLRS